MSSYSGARSGALLARDPEIARPCACAIPPSYPSPIFSARAPARARLYSRPAHARLLFPLLAFGSRDIERSDLCSPLIGWVRHFLPGVWDVDETIDYNKVPWVGGSLVASYLLRLLPACLLPASRRHFFVVRSLGIRLQSEVWQSSLLGLNPGCSCQLTVSRRILALDCRSQCLATISWQGPLRMTEWPVQVRASGKGSSAVY